MSRIVPASSLLVGLALAVGCAQILGEYEVEGKDSVATDGCEVATDCAANEGCDHGVCRERCITSADCDDPDLACCGGEYCADAVGTPCDPSDYDACGGCVGSPCFDRDVNAQPTTPYCSRSCSSSEPYCPSGFVCRDLDCYRE